MISTRVRVLPLVHLRARQRSQDRSTAVATVVWPIPLSCVGSNRAPVFVKSSVELSTPCAFRRRPLHANGRDGRVIASPVVGVVFASPRSFACRSRCRLREPHGRPRGSVPDDVNRPSRRRTLRPTRLSQTHRPQSPRSFAASLPTLLNGSGLRRLDESNPRRAGSHRR
jgi:hypothetical protein